MPRPLRPVAQGPIYHAVNRGNNRRDDGHLLCVLCYIEANPLRAGLVRRAGQWHYNGFAAHGDARPNELLAGPAPCETLASSGARAAAPLDRLRTPGAAER